jgi:peptide methionine sulfoxide reductase MsrB
MKLTLNQISDNINKASMCNKDIARIQLEQIITKMPSHIQNIIEDAFKYKRIPKEYLLSSALFAYGNAAGLAFSITAMSYENFANLYFAIVGSRGDSKSPPMELATNPLKKHDDENYRDFNKRKEDDPTSTFKRKQYLLQDATIEAALYVHYQNPYSIGIFVDELFGLIQKMSNKNSNEGAAWRTFLLQGNTNKLVDISRKTTDSYRIERSCPSLMGSIQSQFIPKLFADGNLESGLIDRLLFTTKLTSNEIVTNKKIPTEVLDGYSFPLNNILQYRNEIENNTQIKSINIKLSIESDKKILEYIQSLVHLQKKQSDHTYEYIAKMQINILKLILSVHLIKHAKTSSFENEITLDTIETAILLNEFYFTNFKIILEDLKTDETKDLTPDELIRYAIKNNKTQKEVIDFTGIHKSTVSRHFSKITAQLATDKSK